MSGVSGKEYCQIEPGTYGQAGYCKEYLTPDCPELKIESDLISHNIFNFNYQIIKDELHYFRDNYLNDNLGGNKIIQEYYKLGKKLSIENLTLAEKIETFNIISSKIIPLVLKLKENPNSTEILINNETNQLLISYLVMIKTKFTDIDSKNRIDHLITKLNHFSNKSNNFVTTNLNDF